MTATVTFHGAAGIVTGSCFEIKTAHGSVLIDCGMYQGTKTVKELNYGRFPFAVDEIKALILTHAHIDHCGLVPKLCRAGYRGPVIATRGTADLLTYVLPDSGYVQEMEVQHLNRRNSRRGRPEVDPIYTRADAEASLKRIVSEPYGKCIQVLPDLAIRFWDAAHILGAASVEVAISDKGASANRLSLLFSGDVGPGNKAFHGEPQAPKEIDFLFAESTYGDRIRPRRTTEQRRKSLQHEVSKALARRGVLLIPAFAVERTQELLSDLDALFDSGALPVVPVFVDSPLATQATKVFGRHLGELGKDGTHPFQRSNLRFVTDANESKKLNRLRSGAIIIAGSGMCDAGRIRHHFKEHLARSDTTVLLVGYQAPGTLGRLLLDGADAVRIQGDEIVVRARIRMLDEYSGHADQRALVKWVAKRQPRLGTFLIHGEESARSALAGMLSASGITRESIHLPVIGESVRLTPEGSKTVRVRAVPGLAEAANQDWHNQYAASLIQLRQRLEQEPTDARRRQMLDRVQKAMNGS